MGRKPLQSLSHLTPSDQPLRFLFLSAPAAARTCPKYLLLGTSFDLHALRQCLCAQAAAAAPGSQSLPVAFWKVSNLLSSPSGKQQPT